MEENEKVSHPIQYSNNFLKNKKFKTYLELAPPPPPKLHNPKTEKTTLAHTKLEKHYINTSKA